MKMSDITNVLVMASRALEQAQAAQEKRERIQRQLAKRYPHVYPRDDNACMRCGELGGIDHSDSHPTPCMELMNDPLVKLGEVVQQAHDRTWKGRLQRLWRMIREAYRS